MRKKKKQKQTNKHTMIQTNRQINKKEKEGEKKTSRKWVNRGIKQISNNQNLDSKSLEDEDKKETIKARTRETSDKYEITEAIK